eukprot:382965_1
MSEQSSPSNCLAAPLLISPSPSPPPFLLVRAPPVPLQSTALPIPLDTFGGTGGSVAVGRAPQPTQGGVPDIPATAVIARVGATTLVDTWGAEFDVDVLME